MRNLPKKVRRELDAKAASEARRNKPKPTNADRILTDVDSLAVFGVAMYLQGCCDGNEEHLPDITVDSLRAYLMQPAPEEGEQNV